MKDLIYKYNIKAKKSFGQNFLINKDILESISNLTNISGENIIEIGPGFGSLTEKILQKKPKSLTLVEIDEFMINILEDRIKNGDLYIGETDFKIVKQDVLKFEPEMSDYKIIANIPYYITSPLLFKFLYSVKNKPSCMVILMQKEVGDKIVSKKSSFLSLSVLKKSIVKKEFCVSRKYFFPAPKVDSVVLYFEITDKFDFLSDDLFLSFIKASFSSPRKKMINNLANFSLYNDNILKKMLELGFDEFARAEDLSIQDYIYLLS